MQDHHTCDPAEETKRTESTILCLLLNRTNQRPWAVEELIREIGRSDDTTDAVASLHGSGLIHRCGDFVFPTRAAVRLDQIDL
jgi:hypothetical protein